jgi:hypothetical protein
MANIHLLKAMVLNIHRQIMYFLPMIALLLDELQDLRGCFPASQYVRHDFMPDILRRWWQSEAQESFWSAGAAEPRPRSKMTSFHPAGGKSELIWRESDWYCTGSAN